MKSVSIVPPSIWCIRSASDPSGSPSTGVGVKDCLADIAEGFVDRMNSGMNRRRLTRAGQHKARDLCLPADRRRPLWPILARRMDFESPRQASRPTAAICGRPHRPAVIRHRAGDGGRAFERRRGDSFAFVPSRIRRPSRKSRAYRLWPGSSNRKSQSSETITVRLGKIEMRQDFAPGGAAQSIANISPR